MRLEFEGFHRWPQAPSDVAYLRDRHRHVFHIEARFAVDHDNRAVEFIQFKGEMLEWLRNRFPGNELGTKSCEQIAGLLLEAFALQSCAVFEDGENGAIVEVMKHG